MRQTKAANARMFSRLIASAKRGEFKGRIHIKPGTKSAAVLQGIDRAGRELAKKFGLTPGLGKSVLLNACVILGGLKSEHPEVRRFARKAYAAA